MYESNAKEWYMRNLVKKEDYYKSFDKPNIFRQPLFQISIPLFVNDPLKF